MVGCAEHEWRLVAVSHCLWLAGALSESCVKDGSVLDAVVVMTED